MRAVGRGRKKRKRGKEGAVSTAGDLQGMLNVVTGGKEFQRYWEANTEPPSVPKRGVFQSCQTHLSVVC
eukprot:768556-Hanusia_phi.AAC.3